MNVREGVFLALVAVAAGCGGKSGPAKPTVKVTPDALTLTTGDFQVPPGTSFTCFYTELKTETAYPVVSSLVHQGLGGHHVSAYYIDTPRSPTSHVCNDAEMLTWHMIATSAEGTQGESFLSPGLAVQIPAGKQIVLQSHYINPGTADETVNDSISLQIGQGTFTLANAFTVVDLNFDAPAGQTYEHQTICNVPQDLDLSLVLGHMHQYGEHFTLEKMAPGDTAWSTIYDYDWVPYYTSHPPQQMFPMDAPLHIAQGTQLRMSCTWDNTTAGALTFPTEMCVAFTYYFPDLGQGEIDCEAN